MSVPRYDLNKVQFSSEANSFKNNSLLYQGTLTLSAGIPVHSSLTSTVTFTIPEAPQFCKLYANYQEFTDVVQQYFVGSGYNGALWYESSVNNIFGLVINSAPHVGPSLQGLVYLIINGTNVTVNATVSNPYADAITYNPIVIPFGFIAYTLTN